MSRLRTICIGLLGGMALGTSAQVTLRDDRGVAHRFERPPARIVSLLPSLTESVCALDACERLVGTDRYSNSPEPVLALPKLGGVDDTQIERVVALRPDVVLSAKSSRVIERLEALGLTVLALESHSHADVQRTLVTLAALLGQPTRAERLWAAIERDLSAAAAQVPPRLRGKKVYFEVGAGPYAAGAASFIGQTLQRLGLGNVVAPELGPFPKLNPEHVVRTQPDIVMGVQREVLAMPGRPGWAHLRALQTGQRCAFPAERYELLVRPGPRLGEAALVISQCLADMATP